MLDRRDTVIVIRTDTNFDLNQNPQKPTYQMGCDYDLQGSPRTKVLLHIYTVKWVVSMISKAVRLLGS